MNAVSCQAKISGNYMTSAKHKLMTIFRKLGRNRVRNKPVIHLYTICWNEEYMLPFFFRHYDDLIDKYYVFDDGSTDNSLEILGKHPKVEVRSLRRVSEDSYVLAAQQHHDLCWKESRGKAEWVIITAIDEFLYHKRFMEYIQKCDNKGITLIPALGYQMISEELPEPGQNLIKTLQRGAPFHQMNKLSLFKPDEISETNFAPGRHSANPEGNIVYPERDELLILHYKYLSFNATVKRHKELDDKRGSLDKEKGWGVQYQWTSEMLRNDWDKTSRNAVADVTSQAYDPDRKHSPLSARWWRA